MSNLNTKQKALLIKKMHGDFLRFWGIEQDGKTPNSTYHIYPLLVAACKAYLEGKRLSLMRACRCVPLSHQNAKQKYVRNAITEGYFNTSPDPNDKRRTFLEPTEKLLQFMEAEIEERIREMAAILEARE